MKKNSFFFAVTAIFFLFFCSFLHAESAKGCELCKNLVNFLEKNDYKPTELPILNNNSAEFPFNIKLEFFPENSSNSNSKNLDNSEDEKISTLAFIFQIEEITENYDFLKKMLDSIKNTSLSGKIQIVFTYGDKLGFGSQNLIAGSERFAEELEDNGDTAIIYVKLNEKATTLSSGGGGDCSPAWLLKLVTNSFYSSNIFYVIKDGFITSLHRQKLLKSEQGTDVFMEKGIPACSVNFALPLKTEEYSKKVADFFYNVAFNFEPEETLTWDRNSKPIVIFNFPIMISEKFTILLFILVSGLSLFVLCEFSFADLFTKNSYSRHLLKKIYIIPICIFITTFAFLLGQNFAFLIHKIFKTSIISCYSIKILFAFLFISLTYFLIFKIQGNRSANVFSFLINIAGIFNIFIFTAIDISLFYVFAVEYIIIVATQKVKRTASLAVLFVMLAAPFIPYFIQFLNNSTSASLLKILMSSLRVNIIFSFAFLPFELVFFRLLARLNYVWKDITKEKKIFIKQNIIAISVSFGIFAVILITVTIFLPSKYKIQAKRPFTEKEIISPEKIKLSYYDESFLEDTTRNFTIKLNESAENVEIKLLGTDGNPILYTDEVYFYSPEGKYAIFNVPTWPPLEMTFSYIADTSQDSIITVSEIIYKEDNKFEKISNSIKIPKASIK